MARANGSAGDGRPRDPAATAAAAGLFAGPGELRARCRALDWAATPLGPVGAWPPGLRAVAGTVLASAFPMVLLWGPALVQVYNDGYRALMGGKHPAGLGQPTGACWPEVWYLNAPIYERVRAGETVVLEDALFPITRGQGSHPGVPEDAWFTLSYSPVPQGGTPDDAPGPNGPSVGGVLVTVFETTAQVRARGARELERERLLAAERAAGAELRAVLESIGDAVYIGGAAGITLANQAALDQLGFATREELNRGVGTLAEEIQTRDAATGAFIPVEQQAFTRALGGERVVQDVVVRHRTLGEDRVVRCAAAPVVVDGRVVAAVAVNTDVTAQVRARRQVESLLAAERAARAEAEQARERATEERERATEANRAKGEFLAAMSHELRTPLNAIGGYAELIELGIHGPVTEAQREALTRIRRAGQHLQGLINDVLNHARLEAGRVQYDVQDVSLDAVVADVEALVAPQLAAKGLAFARDNGVLQGGGPQAPDRLHAAGPLLVRADPEKLRQVLLNLLTNAVKFTASGGRVDLACEVARAADGRADGRADGHTYGSGSGGPGVVRLRVRDTGRGIAAARLASVFEPFVQVDRNLTHASQLGVGLGLSISRDLARGMGGDLTAESTPGVGSTFTLTLPAA